MGRIDMSTRRNIIRCALNAAAVVAVPATASVVTAASIGSSEDVERKIGKAALDAEFARRKYRKAYPYGLDDIEIRCQSKECEEWVRKCEVYEILLDESADAVVRNKRHDRSDRF